MRKCISFVLIALLLLGAVSFSASASELPYMEEKLKEMISAREPDEFIDVGVWVLSRVQPIDRMPSWPDYDKAKQEMETIIAEDIQSFLADIPEDVDYEAHALKLTPIVSLRIKVKDVMKIAGLEDKIVHLYYDTPDDEYIEPPEPQNTERIYEQQFMRWIEQERIDYTDYEELALKDGWALIQAHVQSFDPWDFVGSMLFEDRILSWWHSGAALYPYGLFIYDTKQETFIPIEKVDPKQYTGLTDLMKELKLGRPLGDADNDKELTILDATSIQRDLAELNSLPEDDVYYCETGAGSWNVCRYADYDRSGDVTILDATAIQRTLVDL